MWKTANIILLIGSILCAILQMFWWLPSLPENMPTHFDANGEPDAWASAKNFVLMFATIQAITVVLMLAFTWLIAKLPASMINVPNRQYWLGPRHRKQTLSWTTGTMLLVTSSCVWLFVGIFHLSTQVGLGNRGTTAPEIWWLIGTFFVSCVGIAIYSCLHFRLPSVE